MNRRPSGGADRQASRSRSPASQTGGRPNRGAPGATVLRPRAQSPTRLAPSGDVAWSRGDGRAASRSPSQSRHDHRSAPPRANAPGQLAREVQIGGSSDRGMATTDDDGLTDDDDGQAAASQRTRRRANQRSQSRWYQRGRQDDGVRQSRGGKGGKSRGRGQDGGGRQGGRGRQSNSGSQVRQVQRTRRQR